MQAYKFKYFSIKKKYSVYTQKEEKRRYRVMHSSGSCSLRSYPLLNIYFRGPESVFSFSGLKLGLAQQNTPV